MPVPCPTGYVFMEQEKPVSTFHPFYFRNIHAIPAVQKHMQRTTETRLMVTSFHSVFEAICTCFLAIEPIISPIPVPDREPRASTMRTSKIFIPVISCYQVSGILIFKSFQVAMLFFLIKEHPGLHSWNDPVRLCLNKPE